MEMHDEAYPWRCMSVHDHVGSFERKRHQQNCLRCVIQQKPQIHTCRRPGMTCCLIRKVHQLEETLIVNRHNTVLTKLKDILGGLMKGGTAVQLHIWKVACLAWPLRSKPVWCNGKYIVRLEGQGERVRHTVYCKWMHLSPNPTCLPCNPPNPSHF